MFDCFIQREKTGRKMAPKDVHSVIRAKLELYEYIEEHQSVLYFHDGLRNIGRELYRSQLLQIQIMTMYLRRTMKTVMSVIMKKNKKKIGLIY